MRRPHRALVALALSVPAAGRVLGAQAPAAAPPRVVVKDSTGRPIPYAAVQTAGSNPRTASDSGIVTLRVPRADSLKLLARRMGFEPWEGWVRPDDAGDYPVVLRPLPQNINRVTIYERDTPLSRTGFYDRMERVERGAVVARFWTPEAIELRNPQRVTALLEGENLVRVRRLAGRTFVVGRNAQCPAAILVDGQRMLGTIEEIATPETESEIRYLMATKFRGRADARDAAERDWASTKMSIDEVITSLSIVAVEVYSSLAAAPAELQRNAPAYACSLVVIWTGRRG